MKKEELDKIRSGGVCNIIDLDENEKNFQVTETFEDESNDYVFSLHRGRNSYLLFIFGESWELYLKDDLGAIAFSKPDLSGNIKTMSYREGINAKVL